MRLATRRLLVPLTVTALLAAGCGRDGDSGEEAGDDTTTTTTGAATAAAPGDFGDLKAVCGPGDARGATARGVTDTEIQISTFSDTGAQVQPGLNQELFDTGEAFVKWCNSAGGILGRKIVLHKRDAKLFEAAARMTEACQTDFMTVGGGIVFDDAASPIRLGCNMSEVAGYIVSTKAGVADKLVLPQPGPVDESGTGGPLRLLKQADPSVLPKFGELSSSVGSIKDAGFRDKAAAEALGYTQVYYAELPPFVDNWRPYVENMRSEGVQVQTMLSAPDNLAALLRTMNDVGYYPKYFMAGANMYDPKTLAAGPALEKLNLYVGTNIIPFELANEYPATKQYIELLDKEAGAKPKALGVNSMSAWLLWAQSAKACGSNLTGDCVIERAKATREWTGGGLHGPRQPNNNKDGIGPQCVVLLKASPSGFTVDREITKPNQGIFNCDPANAFKIRV